MNYEIIKELEKEQLKENAPQFSIGDTVRVHNRIKEGNRALRRHGPFTAPTLRRLTLSDAVKSEERSSTISAA